MQKLAFDQIGETIYTETLDNGLNVCLIPKESVTKVFATFTTDFGSADLRFISPLTAEEVTVPPGVAHFLEHKMFDKGEYDVTQVFAKYGGQPNAFTSASETTYYFGGTSHLYENAKTLLDFVQEPYFTDETVDREKGIISQEYQMYADDPSMRLYTEMLDSLFSENEVKYHVLGTLDSINNMTKEDLQAAYDTFYHPSNMVFCVTGNFDPEEMMAFIKENQAEKSFAAQGPVQRIQTAEPVAVAQREKTVHMQVSTPKVMVGIKEYGNPIESAELNKRINLTELTMDCFFNRSGKFYQELYNAGLIDNSFSYVVDLNKNFGFTALESSTDEPEKLASEIKRLLHALKGERPSELQFERLKKRAIGRALRGMNSIEGNAQQYVWHAVRGLDYYKTIEDIQALTMDEWLAFLADWIDEDRLAVCTIRE